MKIKTKTTYLFNGKEFNSVSKVRQEIESFIGSKILDNLPDVKIKDRLKLLELIIDHRLSLVSMLSSSIEIDNDEYNVFNEKLDNL